MSKARQAADEVNRQQAGRRNLIINGAMQVAQRGTSFSVTTTGVYTLDRFAVDDYTGGTLTVSQSTEAPDDFKYSLKVTPASADTSISSTDYARIKYQLEGYDTNAFAFGTSSAKPMTISFYAKTNKTGTYCLALDLLAGTERTYMKEFSLTNSWERYVVTLPANTAQVFKNTTNGQAAELELSLAAGTNYHGTAEDWTNSGFSSSNQVNFMDSTSNELYITGVQLEVGDVATPFEHRSYGEELALCQRYFYNYKRGTTGASADDAYLPFAGQATSTQDLYINIMHPVRMRANPTFSFSGSITSSTGQSSIVNNGDGTVAADSWGGSRGCAVTAARIGDASAIYSAYTTLRTYLNQSSEISFDAEL